MSQGKDISIVIVTYNSKKTIRSCIDSVLKYTPGCEIIVVDNASKDNTAQLVKRYKQKVMLVKSNTNLGFSKGNNLGVRYAACEYLVFLNPDTEVEEEAFTKIKDVLEKNKGFGLVGPRLIYPDGSSQYTVRNLPTISAAFKQYILKGKDAYDFYDPQCIDLCEVESVVGACMIIKKDTFLKIGGFDEKYFLYYEDLDLCRKIRANGLKIGYLPLVNVKHILGASGTSHKTYQLLKESAKKYHGLINYLLIQFIIRIGSVI